MTVKDISYKQIILYDLDQYKHQNLGFRIFISNLTSQVEDYTA